MTFNVKRSIFPVWARIVLMLIGFFIVSELLHLLIILIIKLFAADKEVLSQLSLWQNLFFKLIDVGGLFAFVYFFRKIIDRKSFTSLGFSLKGKGKDIFMGVVFPIVAIGGGSLILYALNNVTFSTVGVNLNILLINFIIYIIVALKEEIVFRGYILNNLMGSMNKYWALSISALLFALVHLFNSNISLLGIINIFLIGLLLGIVYIHTKNLWFAICFHLFWNFIQGPILGYQVSGNEMVSLINVKKLGDNLFTGGDFGFEGSIICTLFCLVLIGLLMLYCKRIKTVIVEI